MFYVACCIGENLHSCGHAPINIVLLGVLRVVDGVGRATVWVAIVVVGTRGSRVGHVGALHAADVAVPILRRVLELQVPKQLLHACLNIQKHPRARAESQYGDPVLVN